MRGMLTVDPKQRITLDNIRQSPWFLREEPIGDDEPDFVDPRLGGRPRDGVDMLGRRATEPSSSNELSVAHCEIPSTAATATAAATTATSSSGANNSTASSCSIKQVSCEILPSDPTDSTSAGSV
jgi:serine/threonine protein kinase